MLQISSYLAGESDRAPRVCIPFSVFWGSPPLIGVIESPDQSQSGDGLMKRKVFALFGVVAVLLTAMAALTLSRVTPLGSGIGDLKCYDIKGEIDNAQSRIDRHSL